MDSIFRPIQAPFYATGSVRGVSGSLRSRYNFFHTSFSSSSFWRLASSMGIRCIGGLGPDTFEGGPGAPAESRTEGGASRVVRLTTGYTGKRFPRKWESWKIFCSLNANSVRFEMRAVPYQREGKKSGEFARGRGNRWRLSFIFSWLWCDKSVHVKNTPHISD